MIVYWNQKVEPKIKVGENIYGNTIYMYEEVFGEVVGASHDSRGGGNKLIIAIPNGELQTVDLHSCKHKSTILRDEVSFEQSNTRKYFDKNLVTNKDDVYTVEEWKECVDDGTFINFDGLGYWVKDGKRSMDEVFSTEQLDATHVIWFNK